MTFAVVVTVILAAAAVACFYALVFAALKSHLFSLAATAPLALSIPWTKSFPAVGDALTLAVLLSFLGLWLYSQVEGARTRRIVSALLLLTFLRPEMITLTLPCTAFELYRRRAAVPPAKALKLLGLVVIAAIASVVVLHPLVSPYFAFMGYMDRLRNGLIWNGSYWMLSGDDIRTSMKSAETYGVTFYFPLLPVFAAMVSSARREWWFTPIVAWASGVFLLTVWHVDKPVFRACPSLFTALLLVCAVPASRLIMQKRGALVPQ